MTSNRRKNHDCVSLRRRELLTFQINQINAVLMRRQSCVEAYAEDAQAPASSCPSGVKRRAALARRTSLPAGTASHTEDQPVTS